MLTKLVAAKQVMTDLRNMAPLLVDQTINTPRRRNRPVIANTLATPCHAQQLLAVWRKERTPAGERQRT
jgi:hypothetical protein